MTKIETNPISVKTQSESARKLAQWFTNHPKIEKMLYPELSGHDGHEIAEKQMHDGFGGMLSVLIKENVDRILEVSNQLRYFTTATSLDGVESLVEYRKSVEGMESTTSENLLRI